MRLTILLAAFGVASAVGFGTASPSDALLTGIDVASYQHSTNAPIDWNAVKGAGHSFGYVKATEYRSSSSSYINPWFKRDWEAAGNAGLYRGAYHFAIPSYPVVADALEEARYFISVTGSMTGPLDLPAMLDLEYNPYGADACYGLSQGDFVTWARTWLDEVKRLTGKAPVVYTGASYWDTCSGRSTAIGGDYRLWIASYPYDPNSTTFRPTLPAGWPMWTMWQYRSDGLVPGIVGNVDVNRFCCDLASLAGLAGSGVGAGAPFGNIESATRLQGSVRLTGWTIDPDVAAAIDIHVYVDGVFQKQESANRARPDVGAAYAGWGSNHGYDIIVKVNPGVHTACAYAINQGAGSINSLLGCATTNGQPVGNFEYAEGRANGSISVSGWAADPDTASPIGIHFYVDGRYGGQVSTTGTRPDVVAAYPGSGTPGFNSTLTGFSAGAHTVCAYAIDFGAVVNPQIGCRVAIVSGGSPIGNLEAVSPGVGSALVSGWVIDPDITDPVEVYIAVDGALVSHELGNRARSDVQAYYPSFGPNHGFSFHVPVSSGTHSVCAYGYNIGAGAHALLGCRSVTNSAKPIGNFEWSARAYGVALGVSGWAVDPDTNAPVQVRVTVNGTVLTTLTADKSRPDVGAAFPGVGDLHGYSHIWLGTAGPARVCLTILNVGAGSTNTDLGCRTL
jgi:GH25 family lysozyme M1 (1,4-beta-N-acetylmuramidase)